MKTKQLLRTLIAPVLVVGSSTLFGQFVTSTKGELGGRQFSGSLASSKFTEYKGLPAGLFANMISFNLVNDDYTNVLSLWGSHIGQIDQNFTGQYGVPGRLKLEFSWDQIPHNYTNTARTVFGGAGGGVLTMPDLVQNKLRTLLTTDLNPTVAGVQFDTTGVSNLVLGTARSVDIVSQRDKARAVLSYSPVDELDIKLQYTNERRSGIKPLGGNFSFNPVEVVEPTVYRTQEANASLEYAEKNWNVQLGYSASLFDNNVDVLVYDNPFREIDAIGNASRGRMDLYPNNTAQNASVSAAANLPLDTRFMATVSHGWRRQNDNFIPYTINTAFDTVANFPKLPAASLDGKVGTTLMNITLVNRLLSSIWFTVRYRTFDYDNQTPGLVFPGYVTSDNTLTNVLRGNAAISYKKTNISLDATLRLLTDASLKLGYERENWNRHRREARETKEDVYKVSFDYTPRSWLFLRTSYSLGSKKTSEYDFEEVALVAYPAGEPAGTLGQLSLLRKFDMATRDRNKATILARVTPDEIITFTGSFGSSDDNFKESQYGLLTNKANNFSFDVSFNPANDLALYASYTGENFNYTMKSKQRSTPAADTAGYDWSSDLKDVVQTFSGGLSWAIDPEKVDFALDYSYSDGKGTIATRAVNPVLVSTAQDYPDTRSILRQFRASIAYRLTEHFTPKLEYRFEDYSESYFNQDVMEPYMVPVDPASSGGVFLGARQPGYSAHIIQIMFSYEF